MTEPTQGARIQQAHDLLTQNFPPAWRPGIVKLCGTEPHTHGAKQPDGTWGQEDCPASNRGKRPVEAGFNKAAAERYRQGEAWIGDSRMMGLAVHLAEGGNVGLVPPPGVAILDCDTADAVDWLGAALPAETPLMHRAEDSAHYYVRYDPLDLPLTARQVKWEEDGKVFAIDLRLPAKSQAVSPPSRHKSGVDYAWSEPLPPLVGDVPLMPPGLVEFFRAFTRKDIEPKATNDEIPGHDRIRTFSMRWARYLTGDGAEELLVEKCRAYAEEVYAERPERAADANAPGGEVERLARSAWKTAGGKDPLAEKATDKAIGSLFVDGSPIKFKRSESEKAWYEWREDSACWRRVEPEYVRQALARFADTLLEDATREMADADKRGRILKLVAKLSMTAGVAAVEKYLASHPDVLVRTNDFDANPWLLTFAASPSLGIGAQTLDLKTGESWSPRPDDLITRCTRAPYSPAIYESAAVDFLRVTFPDKALRDFVQMALGLSLVGESLEHFAPFLYGRGGTGKTTFLNAIAYALGDYATSCPFETLVMRLSPQSPSPHLADWRGRRLIISSEIPDDAKLGATYKNLTGGDEVQVRGLYQSPFILKPTYTIWSGGNDAPKSKHMDTGVARRIKVIPADQVVAPEDMDAFLPAKLREPESMLTLLAWALQGLRAYLERPSRFKPPGSVERATQGYLASQNPLHDWIEEAVTKGPGSVSVPVIRERFERWLEDHFSGSELRERRLSSVKVREALGALGWALRKDRLGKWHVDGVQLVGGAENSESIKLPKLPESLKKED